MILLQLAITGIVYFFAPLVYMNKKRAFTKKQAFKVCLINAIVIMIISAVVNAAVFGEAGASTAPAVWFLITWLVMRSKAIEKFDQKELDEYTDKELEKAIQEEDSNKEAKSYGYIPDEVFLSEEQKYRPKAELFEEFWKKIREKEMIKKCRYGSEISAAFLFIIIDMTNTVAFTQEERQKCADSIFKIISGESEEFLYNFDKACERIGEAIRKVYTPRADWIQLNEDLDDNWYERARLYFMDCLEYDTVDPLTPVIPYKIWGAFEKARFAEDAFEIDEFIIVNFVEKLRKIDGVS